MRENAGICSAAPPHSVAKEHEVWALNRVSTHACFSSFPSSSLQNLVFCPPNVFKMSKRASKSQVEQNIQLGPVVRDGEQVFGVCHIFASFNDTFVHVTDLSGRETLVRVTGGMKVKADRDESSPYAAMLAAQDVAVRCKELGVTALHIKLRATGGNRTKTPGPGAQQALRALARAGMKIGRIGMSCLSVLPPMGWALVASKAHKRMQHWCFLSRTPPRQLRASGNASIAFSWYRCVNAGYRPRTGTDPIHSIPAPSTQQRM